MAAVPADIESGLLALQEQHGVALLQLRQNFNESVATFLAGKRRVLTGVAVLHNLAINALQTLLGQAPTLTLEVSERLLHALSLLKSNNAQDRGRAYDLLRLTRERCGGHESLKENVKRVALLMRELIVVDHFSALDLKGRPLSCEDLKQHMESVFLRPLEPALMSELSLAYGTVVTVGGRRAEYDQCKKELVLPLTVDCRCEDRISGQYRFAGMFDDHFLFNNVSNAHAATMVWNQCWQIRLPDNTMPTTPRTICECRVSDADKQTQPPVGLAGSRWEMLLPNMDACFVQTSSCSDIEMLLFSGAGAFHGLTPIDSDMRDSLFAVYEHCSNAVPYVSKQRASGKPRSGKRKPRRPDRTAPPLSLSPGRLSVEELLKHQLEPVKACNLRALSTEPVKIPTPLVA